MLKIIFFGKIRISVSAQCQHILDAFCGKDSGKFINFCPVVMQAGQMHNRLHMVVLLNLFGKFNRAVTV